MAQLLRSYAVAMAAASGAATDASDPSPNAPSLAPQTPPLAPEVLALLPAADTAPRCAVHAAGIGLDPGGTAICAHAIALVEVPLPWPKPVFAGGLLEGFSSMMELAVGRTRVLATVPPADAVPSADGVSTDRIGVMLHWRDGASTQARYFEADGAEGLRRLFGHLEQHLPSAPVPDDGGFVSFACLEGETAVLICTQGSHDVCCGSEGAPLAADLEAVLSAYRAEGGGIGRDGQAAASEGVTVYRVSHTGGHRFAPTAMTLPDGRMWAGIEAGELASIIDRNGDAAALADRCRGWWGAPTGPAQVAERAVFAQVGWPLEDMAREISLARTAAGWTVEVAAPEADRRWTVEVEAARDVPTIACRALGGLPAKPATEFRVTDVREH